MAIPFAHLHTHTHYSILDGIVPVDRMLYRAKELGQTAMAITDRGVMHGAVDFYGAARKRGMKPLLGFEACVAQGDSRDKPTPEQSTGNHLTLIARNLEGYRNLSRLCSEGALAGIDGHSGIDKEILRQWSGGLVCLSGCLRGEIPQALLAGRMDEAERAALWYRDIFGKDSYFLEIMQNGLSDQRRILPAFRELSHRTGIPLVATADVRYLRPEGRDVQDIMICINTGRLLTDENRMRAEAGCHLKSAEEMLEALPGFEDAVENTMRVVDICNLELPQEGFHLPVLTIPDGMTSVEYMSNICVEGLKGRYGDPLPEEVVERFVQERAVIARMGFADYFLTLWDIASFARERGMPVGPGRGPVAGSIVAYGLGITNLDPLGHGLVFELFLSEDRNTLPSTAFEIHWKCIEEVHAHIIDRHGADRCAHIVAFDSLTLKSAIRDVGRVMDMPSPEIDKLAGLIPTSFKPDKMFTPLTAAFWEIPALKAEYHAAPEIRKLLDAAGELDGVIRNTRMRAYGIIVADRNIADYAPLAAHEGKAITQYETKALDELGLCRIDIYGFAALSLIKYTVESVKKTRRFDIDLERIPLDDKPTYDMLSRGDIDGVFQIEGEWFQKLLTRLRPDDFEDLIAAIAIARPDAFRFLTPYVDRKRQREPITHLHPKMEPLLRETYGLILYPEQVLALAQALANFPLSEGDLMRRAMIRKDAARVAWYREKFIEQAGPDIGNDIAEKVYEQLNAAAGNTFSKAYAACSALVAYQAAYLKCHFPEQFADAMHARNSSV